MTTAYLQPTELGVHCPWARFYANPFRGGGRRVPIHYAAEVAGLSTWASPPVRPNACRWETTMFFRWVSNRVGAPAASFAGVAGLWPARRRSRSKRTDSSAKPTKTFPTPVHRKQRTAHREPRRHARDMQRLVDRRAAGDYTPRASQDETDDETGAGRARRNLTREPCQQAHTNRANNRRTGATNH